MERGSRLSGKRRSAPRGRAHVTASKLHGSTGAAVGPDRPVFGLHLLARSDGPIRCVWNISSREPQTYTTI